MHPSSMYLSCRKNKISTVGDGKCLQKRVRTFKTPKNIDFWVIDNRRGFENKLIVISVSDLPTLAAIPALLHRSRRKVYDERPLATDEF